MYGTLLNAGDAQYDELKMATVWIVPPPLRTSPAVMQSSSHTKKGAALASRALHELPCGGRRYGRAIFTIAVAPSVKVAR